MDSRANQDARAVVEYLETHWSRKIVQRFLWQLREEQQRIAKNPELNPASSKDKNIRRAVLNKQLTIYYRIESDCIRILTLWDNRRNPEDLNLNE